VRAAPVRGLEPEPVHLLPVHLAQLLHLEHVPAGGRVGGWGVSGGRNEPPRRG
jgi:hypothetical protein